MTVKIICGGDRISNLTTRLFDDGNSTPVWSGDHFGLVHAVAADSDGNCYVAGVTTTDTTDFTVVSIRKYDIDGNILWRRRYHNSTIRGLAVNDAGDVIVCGNRTSSITTRKYNSSGTELWTADHGDIVYCVAMDSSGNVYTGGIVSGGVSIRKYNSSGTQQWTANHGGTVYCIAVDGDGNVYVGGVTVSFSYNVRQYDSAGNLNWSRNYTATSTSGTVYGIAVDVDKNVYICAKAGGTLGTVRKYNSSGTQQWESSYGDGSDLNATPAGISLDGNGTVWVVGTRSANVGQLVEYNNSGTYQSQYTHGFALNAVKAFQVAVVTTVPAMALAFALATPGAGPAFVIPALPLSFAFATPSPSAPPIPPIGDGTVIYRGYLTGGLTLVELPLVALECRRRQDASTWLAVTLPSMTSAQRAALLAAMGTGQIVIYSGLRDSNGAETLGEFLRATLVEYAETSEPMGSTVTLTARVAAVLETLQSRILEDVIGRASDRGRRSIRCLKINPILRPGDTVVDGDISFVAHSVTYRISATDCWMDVIEAPIGG